MMGRLLAFIQSILSGWPLTIRSCVKHCGFNGERNRRWWGWQRCRGEGCPWSHHTPTHPDIHRCNLRWALRDKWARCPQSLWSARRFPWAVSWLSCAGLIQSWPGVFGSGVTSLLCGWGLQGTAGGSSALCPVLPRLTQELQRDEREVLIGWQARS